jgi:hypothetical protein
MSKRLTATAWVVLGRRDGGDLKVLDMQDTAERARHMGERYEALGYDDVRIIERRLSIAT